MSKLSQLFDSIRHVLHHGPSCEPFHMGMIEEHDALEARVAALEAKSASDHDMMEQLRAGWAEVTARPDKLNNPVYIEPAQAVVSALSGAAPDDPASLTVTTPEQTAPVAEQNPAEPVQTPVHDLPSAQPEPVPAGPDEVPVEHAADTESTAPAAE